MLVAAVSTKRAANATGKRSQVQVGSTPQARTKARTTIRLRQKLKAAVITVASGITSRGNWVLRTTASWVATEVTAFGRRFLEERVQDDAEQQQHRVVLQAAAEFEDLGEDEEQDAEEHQRPDQRPEVAEDRAEVDPLELGDRDQPEQVEEAAGAAAERGRAADVAQRWGRPSAPSLRRAFDRRRDLVREGDDPAAVSGPP